MVWLVKPWSREAFLVWCGRHWHWQCVQQPPDCPSPVIRSRIPCLTSSNQESCPLFDIVSPHLACRVQVSIWSWASMGKVCTTWPVNVLQLISVRHHHHLKKRGSLYSSAIDIISELSTAVRPQNCVQVIAIVIALEVAFSRPYDS